MADDPKKKEVPADKKRLEKLERELEELRASKDRSRTRALMLEERMKREALTNARRRVLEESVGRRGLALDPGNEKLQRYIKKAEFEIDQIR